MGVVKIKIEEKNFEIECEDGEEDLLEKAASFVNKKIQDHPQFKTLPESKKFLMISLTLAGESVQNNLINKSSTYSKDIFFELSKLEELVKKKFNG